jgi:hypothetical protein
MFLKMHLTYFYVRCERDFKFLDVSILHHLKIAACLLCWLNEETKPFNYSEQNWFILTLPTRKNLLIYAPCIRLIFSSSAGRYNTLRWLPFIIFWADVAHYQSVVELLVHADSFFSSFCRCIFVNVPP